MPATMKRSPPERRSGQRASTPAAARTAASRMLIVASSISRLCVCGSRRSLIAARDQRRKHHHREQRRRQKRLRLLGLAGLDLTAHRTDARGRADDDHHHGERRHRPAQTAMHVGPSRRDQRRLRDEQRDPRREEKPVHVEVAWAAAWTGSSLAESTSARSRRRRPPQPRSPCPCRTADRSERRPDAGVPRGFDGHGARYDPGDIFSSAHSVARARHRAAAVRSAERPRRGAARAGPSRHLARAGAALLSAAGVRAARR